MLGEEKRRELMKEIETQYNLKLGIESLIEEEGK